MDIQNDTIEEPAAHLDTAPPIRRSRLAGLGRELLLDVRGPLGRAMRLTLVLLVLCGGIYPFILWGVGQLAFARQANGTLLYDRQGRVVGSSLIGQAFGRPEYFHGRPSAVGYNAAASGGSNLGPTNPQLATGNTSYGGVLTYTAQFRRENGLAATVPLPTDIVTASGSGIDPHISPAAAALQVARIVTARHALGGQNAPISAAAVQALVSRHTAEPDLGFLGEPCVNVLELNLALDTAYAAPPATAAGAPSR